MLDQIRNKVLAFALEIEALDPAAGDGPAGQSKVETDKVTQVFNSVFYGSVGAVGIGTPTQMLALTVTRGDRDSLSRALRQAGIPDEELEALDRALEDDGGQLGEQVRSWQDAVVEKIQTGSVVLAEGISVTIVADAIARFLGLT